MCLQFKKESNIRHKIRLNSRREADGHICIYCQEREKGMNVAVHVTSFAFRPKPKPIISPTAREGLLHSLLGSRKFLADVPRILFQW